MRRLVLLLAMCSGCVGRTVLMGQHLPMIEVPIEAANLEIPSADVPTDEQDVGEAVAAIKKGQKAPFSGVLFSQKAAARVTVELEMQSQKCALDVKKAVDSERAVCDMQVSDCNIQKTSSAKICDEKIRSRDDALVFAEKKLEKLADPMTEWWFMGGLAGGLVVGVATTIAIAYAVAPAGN